MKRIFHCTVSNQIELLYAKTCLKNFLKTYVVKDRYFLELAVMELGTNLLKYSGSGELWFLLIQDTFALASVDLGVGVDDIDIIKQKGYSSRTNQSLGLGLYSLATHKAYDFDVISFTQKNTLSLRGSVFVLYEKNVNRGSFCSMSLALYDSEHNGDFVAQKGNTLFVGDISGHGKKAFLSASQIINHFYNTTIFDGNFHEYFQKLHRFIAQNALRSFVGCFIELHQETWKLSGVGNISVAIKQNGHYKLQTFAQGIVGEAFENASSLEFLKKEVSLLMLMTDGIDAQRALEVLEKFDTHSKESLAVAILHFAGLHDDKTVVII